MKKGEGAHLGAWKGRPDVGIDFRTSETFEKVEVSV